VPGVHRQVQELFVGEQDLVDGFEQFLPESVPKKGSEVGGDGGNGGEGEGEGVKEEE
jgi:histone deacetylase complex regulatory component SIN3